MLDVVLRIRAETRTPDAPDDLAHLAEPHLPLIRDGGVDRDAVDPGLSRRDGLPRAPFLVGALERVLGAVLRRGSIAQHGGQRAKNLAVRRLVQALEISLVSRRVLRLP